MILELSNSSRRYRSLTDRDGFFTFTGVRLGEWTPRVVHAKLPPHHHVEGDGQTVRVAPGEHVELTVRAGERRIRMVGSGTLQLKQKD